MLVFQNTDSECETLCRLLRETRSAVDARKHALVFQFVSDTGDSQKGNRTPARCRTATAKQLPEIRVRILAGFLTLVVRFYNPYSKIL